MPTLEHDRVIFRFPHLERVADSFPRLISEVEAKISIDFQRTLRIPDTNSTYRLPPGLGRFPLRHVEDFADRLPDDTARRGGIFLPMWQAEAMWLHFRSKTVLLSERCPVAIKVAAGKINAVTGESWQAGLHRDPQDYVVAPRQRWLDGFAVAKDEIRQFVAMPLGEGYSAEEQLTGEATWGGLQISATPLRQEVWTRILQQEMAAKERLEARRYVSRSEGSEGLFASMSEELRLKFQVQHPRPNVHRMLRWTDEASTSAARTVA